MEAERGISRGWLGKALTMDTAQDDTGKPKDGAGRPITFTASSASGRDETGSTLLPMLIVGLVLIVVGMVAVVLVF